MIAYVDSSLLARAYLPDDDGHDEARALLEDLDIVLVTGSLTKIEVSGALVRAARAGRAREATVLAMLDGDVSDAGPITVVGASQTDVEMRALALVRQHGIRAMDAWHLATAVLALPALAEPGEGLGFASRDDRQAEVAETLGLQLI